MSHIENREGAKHRISDIIKAATYAAGVAIPLAGPAILANTDILPTQSVSTQAESIKGSNAEKLVIGGIVVYAVGMAVLTHRIANIMYRDRPSDRVGWVGTER